MLRVGVVGATGYTGEELVKLLISHSDVRLTYLSALVDKPLPISKVFPSLSGRCNLFCENFSFEKAVSKCDLIFLALPHTVSMAIAPKLIKSGKKVIDLSADYRLKNVSLYKEWYGKSHRDKKNLKKFVYGLPELFREKIKTASFIANPGCYPTAAILGILPILISGFAEKDSIIIDSKSGVTGAGRKASLAFFFSEINENFKGYKFDAHQHSPEIEQELSRVSSSRVKVVFCPHLLPLNRGIYETIYVRLNKQIDMAKVIKIYTRFYKQEPFVRVKEDGTLPQIKDVEGTNFCDIGLTLDKSRKLLIISSVIDNLLKGAAGQAVQNLNIMCGFPEEKALK